VFYNNILRNSLICLSLAGRFYELNILNHWMLQPFFADTELGAVCQLLKGTCYLQTILMASRSRFVQAKLLFDFSFWNKQHEELVVYTTGSFAVLDLAQKKAPTPSVRSKRKAPAPPPPSSNGKEITKPSKMWNSWYATTWQLLWAWLESFYDWPVEKRNACVLPKMLGKSYSLKK